MPRLDFLPQTPSSELFPLCQWKGHHLNHFNESQRPFNLNEIDLSHLSLAQALKSVYSELSFTELGRLRLCLTNESLDEHLEQIVTAYGYGYDQRLLQCFDILFKLSPAIQDWTENHNIAPRELLPLAALSEIPIDLLETLSSLNVSRNYGAQLIELIVENLLLEHSVESLLISAPLTLEKVPTWIEHLKKLRFPETNRLDEEKKETLTSLPWTKDFQTRWQRKGDQSGLEIKFTITSPQDLKLKLQTLERVLEKYND